MFTLVSCTTAHTCNMIHHTCRAGQLLFVLLLYIDGRADVSSAIDMARGPQESRSSSDKTKRYTPNPKVLLLLHFRPNRIL
jgi:hypothetical protein